MSRELLDQEVARSFREAQLNRKRWARMAEALELCDDIPAPVAQLCLACRAASELFYRSQSRRLFDTLDRLTTDIIPGEGDNVTDGQKVTLLARAEWHRKLATQARKDAELLLDHAAMHERLSSQLRDLALHGAPGEQPAPAKKVIRRSII
jgi:hypothetical protein